MVKNKSKEITIPENFSQYSVDEMEKYLWSLYKEYGVEALEHSFLIDIKGLYFKLYYKGIKPKEFIKKVGLEEEYKQYRAKKGWTWDKIIKEVAPIVEDHGYLPPAGWFQQNKMSGLVFAVYNIGKTWNDLRAQFDSYEGSDFVESRNGLRWRSHPEASLSNFLYTRGIAHQIGEKYPEEYAKYGDASYGYYDLHFKSSSDCWIDVEVWGDKPNGHNEEGYKKVREAKERFNKENPHINFLGIQYQDCFDENKLESLLEPYIGNITPFIFEKPTDRIIQSTHWSNSDELIEYCKEIAKARPNGIFPAEDWLRKRGRWKDRDGETYNTVSIYIKTWIGGIRKLREILNQGEHSTTVWTKEKAIEEYRLWFEKHGITPGQVKTRKELFNKDDYNLAINITSAVTKHVGSTDKINELLGIKPNIPRKWNREKILNESERIFKKYSLTSGQVKSLSTEEIDLFKVIPEDIIISRNLSHVAPEYFSGSKEVYLELGIQPIDKRRLKKRLISNESNSN